jgi:hypothetical protein
MQIELVTQPEALVRWREVLADPELARWPGRIETDPARLNCHQPAAGIAAQLSPKPDLATAPPASARRQALTVSASDRRRR